MNKNRLLLLAAQCELSADKAIARAFELGERGESASVQIELAESSMRLAEGYRRMAREEER